MYKIYFQNNKINETVIIHLKQKYM